MALGTCRRVLVREFDSNLIVMASNQIVTYYNSDGLQLLMRFQRSGTRVLEFVDEIVRSNAFSLLAGV